MTNKRNQFDLFDQDSTATADGQHWCVPDLRQTVKQRYGIEYKTDTSYRQLFQFSCFGIERRGMAGKQSNNILMASVSNSVRIATYTATMTQQLEAKRP